MRYLGPIVFLDPSLTTKKRLVTAANTAPNTCLVLQPANFPVRSALWQLTGIQIPMTEFKLNVAFDLEFRSVQ